MENQHKHIKGYRDLSQAEIDLMNEIKQKGEELRTLVAKINAVAIPKTENNSSEIAGDAMPWGLETEGDQPEYWLRYADASFRSGIMYAVRAVAKPQSY